MQSADTVLGVLRERGRRGLPCDALYRRCSTSTYICWPTGKIHANHGAMTPGASAETEDGMSEDNIQRIIEAMRCERYPISPVRRTFIPK